MIIILSNSHMSNNKLSFADIAYARKIICHNEIDQLFMLLYVLSEEKIYVYVVGDKDVYEDRVEMC